MHPVVSLTGIALGLIWVSPNKTDTFIRSGKMKGVSGNGEECVAAEIQCGV